jgi:hypothetical protein
LLVERSGKYLAGLVPKVPLTFGQSVDETLRLGNPDIVWALSSAAQGSCGKSPDALAKHPVNINAAPETEKDKTKFPGLYLE